jgi:hypothetical protein
MNGGDVIVGKRPTQIYSVDLATDEPFDGFNLNGHPEAP